MPAHMPPPIDDFDHVHVYVADRPAAEKWYADVLGFRRKKKLEAWAVPHGPLMLENGPGSAVLALFEKSPQSNLSTIAFKVRGAAFFEWLAHLSQSLDQQLSPVDHGLAWSLYFSDPDGNPFEIITYDYALVSRQLTGNQK